MIGIIKYIASFNICALHVSNIWNIIIDLIFTSLEEYSLECVLLSETKLQFLHFDCLHIVRKDTFFYICLNIMKTLINECYQSHLLWKYMVNVHLILLHTLTFEIWWIICVSLENIEFPSEATSLELDPHRCNPNTAYPSPQTRCRVLHTKTMPSPGGAEYSGLYLLGNRSWSDLCA